MTVYLLTQSVWTDDTRSGNICEVPIGAWRDRGNAEAAMAMVVAAGVRDFYLDILEVPLDAPTTDAPKLIIPDQE